MPRRPRAGLRGPCPAPRATTSPSSCSSSATSAGASSVTFAVKQRTGGWRRLAVDDSPPFQGAFLDAARYRRNEPVHLVAIARGWNGSTYTSRVALHRQETVGAGVRAGERENMMKGRIWGVAVAAALLLTVLSAMGSDTPPPTGVTIAGSLQSEPAAPATGPSAPRPGLPTTGATTPSRRRSRCRRGRLEQGRAQRGGRRTTARTRSATARTSRPRWRRRGRSPFSTTTRRTGSRIPSRRRS